LGETAESLLDGLGLWVEM
jgi:hypothetical protein